MDHRLILAALVAVVGTCNLPAGADDKPDGDLARVEVRGKLEPWKYNRLDRDRYAVRCKGKEKEADQVFVLDLLDKEISKVAEGLNGRAVVVTGDITLRKEFNGDRPGTHIYAMAIRVKSLKGVEQTPKK